MKINLRYFASMREGLGLDSETVDLPATTVAGVRQQLMLRGEPYATVLASARLRAAVNHSMVGFEQAVSDGDEVAFFPPVTGG